MKEIIQATIEKMIADGWITPNKHLNKEMLGAVITDSVKQIKVVDFLRAFELD